jgi:hypothetical protein
MRRESIHISATALFVLILCGSVWAAAGNVLFEDDFNDGDAKGWEEYDGLFSVVSGVYQVESTGRYNDARSVAGDLSWTDYVIELYFNNQTTDRAACVLFRVQEVASGMDAGRYYQLHIRSNKVGFAEIDYSGGYATLLAEVPYTVSSQTWHHLQIRINGTRAIALIDGKYVLSYDDFGKYAWGKMGLKIINGGVVLYDNVTVSDANGPIAHWKFDEGSGSVAYDSAGTNDGTIHGATWTTGQLVGALDFDGVNDYVEIPDDPSLDITDELTVNAWVKYKKQTETGPRDIVWSARHWRYSLRRHDDIYQFIIYDTTTGLWQKAETKDITFDKDTWYHLVGTYRNGDKVKIYVNGTLNNEISISTITLNPQTEYIRVGVAQGLGTGAEWFDGAIDDVRIYDRALSAQEIRDIYVSYPSELLDIDIKPGSCPNPLNVKSKGVLPVAVLGSQDFDVSIIDVASIRLAGVAPIRSGYEDVATPVSDVNECECSTEGPDGFDDLIIKFETQEIVDAIGEVDHGDELVLELTGVLSDETPIEGSDCVIIRGRHKPLNRADFNGDGIVDMADFAAFTENWLQ